ncbi:hypothetical protein X777_14015 [Ooceraea biroi]|uniref:Uncharacterized protein n=1 Tax=Ooceraea biroi TaxID=2015173 RepID=A0A026X048_OOCBI|nr:hypothetical protein X777_14015 [Ooceraea biroi]
MHTLSRKTPALRNRWCKTTESIGIQRKHYDAVDSGVTKPRENL